MRWGRDGYANKKNEGEEGETSKKIRELLSQLGGRIEFVCIKNGKCLKPGINCESPSSGKNDLCCKPNACVNDSKNIDFVEMRIKATVTVGS